MDETKDKPRRSQRQMALMLVKHGILCGPVETDYLWRPEP